MWVYMIAGGGILLLMKWFQVEPVSRLSWWWVVLPLILCVIYFEVIEPMFGLDKKRAHSELDKVKKSRIAEQLKREGVRRR